MLVNNYKWYGLHRCFIVMFSWEEIEDIKQRGWRSEERKEDHGKFTSFSHLARNRPASWVICFQRGTHLSPSLFSRSLGFFSLTVFNRTIYMYILTRFLSRETIEEKILDFSCFPSSIHSCKFYPFPTYSPLLSQKTHKTHTAFCLNFEVSDCIIAIMSYVVL